MAKTNSPESVSKLTRCASEGDSTRNLPVPSLSLFEVADLYRNPEGSQRLASGRRRRTTGNPVQWHSHPGGMPATQSLASLRDAASPKTFFRWYRFAKPPANRFEPSGLNRKCVTSKFAFRVRFGVLTWLLLIAVCPLGAEQSRSVKSKTAKSSATSDSPVVARVNGQPITEADLDFFAKTLKITSDELPRQRDAMIEALIDRKLLQAFLAQKKVAADPQRLEAHLTQLKTRLKAKGQDFDKLLAKSGFTEDSLRRELKLPLDWDEYARREATDEKLRDTWKTRKAEFDGSEVRAAQIALKSDDPAADEKKLAELRSEILAKKITFADAAKKHSQAPSAAKGGDLGRFGFRGKQPPPYPQIAFSLKVGDVSAPVRSPFGVLLLTVTERIDGQLSLEDARPEILKQLSNETQRDVLSRERSQAKIERP